MADWTAVAALDDLPTGEIYGVAAGELKLILVRLGDDEIVAYEDKCPHEGTALSDLGDYEADEEILICNKHLWEFEVRTGEHLSKLHLPDTDLLRFPVRIADGAVEVDLAGGARHQDEAAG